MDNRSLRILIVEDDPATRFLLNAFLSDLGQTTICEDGNQAWNHLADGNQTDLIVTDHEMPNLSGRDLILKIRACDREFKDLPIIMVTASISREEMAGIALQGFLEKPVTRDVLLLAARSALAG